MDDLVTKKYHDEDLSPVKNNIQSLQTESESLRNRVDQAEKDIDNLESNLETSTGDISELKLKVEKNEGDISNLQTNVQGLQTNVKTVENNITKLESTVENHTTYINDLKEDLATEVKEREDHDITSIEGGLGANKTGITLTKKNGETLSTDLTIASNTQNGLMPSSAYSQITKNADDIAALKNQGGRYIGVSFETYAQLVEYVVPETVRTGDYTFVLDDETHEDSTTRYIYDGTKFNFAFVVEHDPVGLATEETAGLVLGSTSPGQVFVEQDGTMSLNGYDNILTKINSKVDKVEGKGLSSNDFTQEYIDKINILNNNGQGDLFLGDDGEYHQIEIPKVKVQDILVNQESIVDQLGLVNLATIAVTGSYNDLKDVPNDIVRDASYVHTDNNFTTDHKIKVDLLDISGTGSKVLTDAGVYTRLADVAASGSYLDLTDVPENLVQDADYNHTDNNFTDELKERLLEIKDTGEINVIESVSVNGDQLPVDEQKNVNIDLTPYALDENVPTKLSDLQNDNFTVQDEDYVQIKECFRKWRSKCYRSCKSR